MLVSKLLEAEENASREKPNQEVQVEEESWPSGRLVLGDRSNDWDVNLGIACVPERVEPTAPRSNVAERCQTDESCQADTEGGNENSDQEGLELLASDRRSDVLDEADELDEAENT
jgi:hypothetical protein